MQFIDLAAQQAAIRGRIDARIAGVLDHGKYIMGPEVAEFEKDLSEFCSAKSTSISCSNGTDAISLVLMGMGIGPGDAVVCPSFTFASTAEVIALQGAVPVFVDVLPDTFNMDPESLKAAINLARDEDLNLRAVLTVDLFGQPCDYDAIEPICAENNLPLICDAAQGFGGVYKGRFVGTIGLATTTSFFPAKPLGCYGDGGAVLSDDEDLREAIMSLRVHGKGTDKYDNIRIGLNARLDTIQAAILIEKLAIFPKEIKLRQAVADNYKDALDGFSSLILPHVPERVSSGWAQYTLRVDAGCRCAIIDGLRKHGVPSFIYYGKPLHEQTAYAHYPKVGTLQTTHDLSKQVFSLPMHPYLKEDTQDKIVSALRKVI